ncbi:MAG: serpin family protein [Bacteroidales bacterium]|nr:serpin family protein [Bacteroidales bacterium]
MKKIVSSLLFASLLFALVSCNKNIVVEEQQEPNNEQPQLNNEKPEPAKPIELTTKQSERTNADNRFAFNIFKEVSASEGANTFFSPLSLSMALGMLYNGVSGETRTEMAQVLGMADFTDTEINEYYQKLTQALLNIDPLTEISIANSIWYRIGFPVKQSFIDVNQNYFDAMVEALDFSRPDAAEIINKWCAEKTKNRIETIIDDPIGEDVIMYLINALYFKSKWQFEFDKKDTKQDDFTKADGQKVRINMMEQTTALPYYADQNVQCVEMPYGNHAFSMVVILGNDNMNIDQLVEYLDNDTWHNIVENLYNRNIHLKLPRFKIECEMNLNEPVKQTGMQRIFCFLKEFDNICSGADLAVSKIKQKTFVEVNEEGTEAAAVTSIEIIETISSPPSGPTQFFANRPFLYLIKEKSTGAILFMGRMDEPQE